MDASPIKWWLIFTSYDPVVWSYIACLVLLFIADIRFGVAVRVMRIFSHKAKTEDSVFIIAIISSLPF